MIARFLTWLLGPPCPLGCGARVYDADRADHWRLEHAGDHWPDEWVDWSGGAQ